MPTKHAKTMTKKDTDKLFEARIQGVKKDFLWLMEHLLPYNEKIKGCELIFPDTVFF